MRKQNLSNSVVSILLHGNHEINCTLKDMMKIVDRVHGILINHVFSGNCGDCLSEEEVTRLNVLYEDCLNVIDSLDTDISACKVVLDALGNKK